MRSRIFRFTVRMRRIFGVTEEADSKKIPMLNSGVVLRSEAFGFLVFDPRTSTVLRTNPVGAEIIRNCDGKKSTGEIGEAIGKVFDVEAKTALNDTDAFIGRLLESGVVEYV